MTRKKKKLQPNKHHHKKQANGSVDGKSSSRNVFSVKKEIKENMFNVVHIEADGNCLFRALSYALHGDQAHHASIREMVVSYMEGRRDEFEPFMEDEEDFIHYCGRMAQDGVWGGNQELCAASRAFQINISIWSDETRIDIPYDEESSSINLLYNDSEHYDYLEQEKHREGNGVEHRQSCIKAGKKCGKQRLSTTSVEEQALETGFEAITL